jgi:hypothetical protein
VEIGPDVPDWLASLAGTSMIVAAFIHSAVRAKGEDRAGADSRVLKS